MRSVSVFWLSLVAIGLIGCGSSESPAPVGSTSIPSSAVAINDVAPSETSATPDDAPLDASLITLHLPGMT